MMKPVAHAATILLIAAVAASATWWIKGPPETGCDPQQIEAGQICIQDVPADREVVWIDARSRSEWERNGLPGSVLWNLDATEDKNAMEQAAVMEIFNISDPYVIVYCSDKGCGTSKKIAERIEALDLGAEVHVLYDGWKALEQAGLVGSNKE